MSYMTNEQAKALRTIIYQCESGGRYDCFISAYTNTSLETGITIGAGQWHANNARNLLKTILKEYPAAFRKYDTGDIEADLANDWTNYNLAKDSIKANIIKSIISSEEGKKVQDKLFDAQMESYIDSYYKEFGIRDMQCLAMLCNFEHHGGRSAVKRILAKTPKPYTLDSVYNASRSDTGNQVGAYRERQTTVYNYLKNNFPNSTIEEIKPVKKEEEKKNTGTTLNTSIKWTGTVSKDVIPRVYAGLEYNRLKSIDTLVKGSKIGICDTVKAVNNADWYYFKYNSIYGFVPASSVKDKVDKQNNLLKSLKIFKKNK